MRDLISARGLVLSATAVIGGVIVLAAWVFFFFAASERDHWVTWALYYLIRGIWMLLVIGGLIAFIGINALLLVKHFSGA